MRRGGKILEPRIELHVGGQKDSDVSLLKHGLTSISSKSEAAVLLLQIFIALSYGGSPDSLIFSAPAPTSVGDQPRPPWKTGRSRRRRDVRKRKRRRKTPYPPS